MSLYKAAITAVAGYVPDNVLSNADLEKMVDTNDEWITSRTGIKQRHILNTPGQATSDMAVHAVKDLLAKSNTDPDDIELLICGTVTADMVFPDTANTICDKVGIKNAFGFDINAACSGFLYSLSVGAKFIEAGTHKKVIIVGADMMSSIINYKDRSTCIIFGDGAGCVLLERSEDECGIIDSYHRSDGSGREFLHMKAGGSLKPATAETVAANEHYVYQEGRSVFKRAVSGMSSTVKKVMQQNNLTNDDIAWVVPHQANIRIIESVANMLDYPMDKVMVNIHNYGNTTAATIPLALNDYESQLRKGDNIMLTAFGGGFTWGTTYLKWAYDGK